MSYSANPIAKKMSVWITGDVYQAASLKCFGIENAQLHVSLNSSHCTNYMNYLDDVDNVVCIYLLVSVVRLNG